MPKVYGSFVIRDEGQGCLTSKFLEHTDSTPFVECCKLKAESEKKEKFEGDYRTTWIEPNNIRHGDLEIRRLGDVYRLRWTNIEDSLDYEGRAILFEEKLVGSYWSV